MSLPCCSQGSQKRPEDYFTYTVAHLVSFLFTIATDSPANISANSSSPRQRHARFSGIVTEQYGMYFRAFKWFSMNFQRFLISVHACRKISSRCCSDLSTSTYWPPPFLAPLDCSGLKQSRGEYELFIFRPRVRYTICTRHPYLETSS